MKRLLLIFFFILDITSGSHPLYGFDTIVEKGVNIITTFTMNVLYDGMPTDDTLFVSLIDIWYYRDTPLKIVGTEKSGSYHIEGSGLWWDDTIKKEVKVKWYSIKTLPYFPAERKALFL